MRSWLLLGCLMGSTVSLAQGAKSKRWGLGIVLGKPDGLSAKYRMSGGYAVDFALGYSQIHTTFLVESGKVINHPFAILRLYAGLGLFGLQKKDRAGIRAAGGFYYLFRDPRIDFFLEFTPQFVLVPDQKFQFHGAFGARYYF